MAADILLYQTDIVPGGKDQKQHVELAREIARRFNNKFGQTFNLPEVMLPKIGAKIMSLTNPSKKMSKSDPALSYISLFDPPEEIKKKIRKAQTDSGKEIKYEPKTKPAISNLLTIYSLFSEIPISEVEKKFKGKGYQLFKEKLANLLIEKLKIFRKKKKELELKKNFLKEILTQGRKKAQLLAEQTIEKVKKQMGLF